MSELIDVEPLAMLLCSQCYGARRCTRFTATVPRSTCAACGRRCLGFLIEGPPARRDPSAGWDRLTKRVNGAETRLGAVVPTQ